MPVFPPDIAADVAAEFPRLSETAPYLNAASVAPIPERCRGATEAYNTRRTAVHELRDDDFDPTLQRCREAAARLIGADAADVALMGNTSHGINLAAQLLPVAPGQRIVVSDWEFPANVYPWMARARRDGVTLTRVPCDGLGRPDEARIFAELDRGDVAVFALSAVQFATGWRADLAAFGRFCEARGIRFVVDGIQALGQMPLDVGEARIDVLATGGHKWLCGPFGTGFTYLRREVAEALEPAVIGWTSMSASADYSRCVDYEWDWVAGARRFEVATQPLQDIAGFTESLRLLDEVGVERIRAHVLGLLDPLASWLTVRGVQIVSDLASARRSGIFCFRPANMAAALRALQEAGVVCVPREGAIRLSPHLYNTAGQIGRVIEVLDAAGVR